MSDIEQLEIDFDTWFNREFSDHKANWTINEYASAKTAAWKSWQAAKQENWTKCSDHLPPCRRDVLLKASDRDYVTLGWHDGTTWFTWNGKYDINWFSHWQSLPQPPKEQS